VVAVEHDGRGVAQPECVQLPQQLPKLAIHAGDGGAVGAAGLASVVVRQRHPGVGVRGRHTGGAALRHVEGDRGHAERGQRVQRQVDALQRVLRPVLLRRLPRHVRLVHPHR
jgi:hypothetical protein